MRSRAGGVERLDRRDRRRFGVHDRADQARLALALERLLPGHHLVDDGAEREDVRARVSVFPFELLGCHVLQRAENRALRGEAGGVVGMRTRCRQRRERGGLREAEVEQLRAALASA